MVLNHWHSIPAHRSYSNYIRRFLVAHGSPNYGHSGICYVQREFAFTYTIGCQPRCDYKNADLIILWGRQPIYSGPAMGAARSLVAAKRRGAKIIAIKPSVEPDVGMADIWAPLRPGTDAALALSMLNVIVDENVIDEKFVETWCYGYEQLREHVRKYPPEWGERISGVPAAQIREIARRMPPPSGDHRSSNGASMPSSNDAIVQWQSMAITGHLDRPGGNLLLASGAACQPQTVNLRRYTQKWWISWSPRNSQGLSNPGGIFRYYRIFDSVL